MLLKFFESTHCVTQFVEHCQRGMLGSTGESSAAVDEVAFDSSLGVCTIQINMVTMT